MKTQLKEKFTSIINKYFVIHFSLTIVLYFLAAAQVQAQMLSLPDTANFYDYLNAFYASPEYDATDTAEGGYKAQHERLILQWGNRLYPHGDFSVANKAIIDYSSNFTPVNTITENPNWVCLGPSNGPSNSGSNGVGQIHRITFDPKYDGVNNQIIYACTGFGGLWRTENDGFLWENVNTDTGLPLSSAADVAIHPENTDTLFMATGLPDNGVNLHYSPNWSNTNPIYTIGIFRSLNYGQTWNPINDGFIEGFYDNGGTVRKLTIDVNNGSILLLIWTC